MPSTAGSRAHRSRTGGRSGAGTCASSTPGTRRAPHSSTSSRQAIAMARGGSSRGRPFSKRLLDSVRRPSDSDAFRMAGPSKVAASSSTRVVDGPTSANSAPKTPAITAGRSASQIVSTEGSSVRSWPSRVTMRSPSSARRTTTAPPASRSRSNAWSGCAVSSIT